MLEGGGPAEWEGGRGEEWRARSGKVRFLPPPQAELSWGLEKDGDPQKARVKVEAGPFVPLPVWGSHRPAGPFPRTRGGSLPHLGWDHSEVQRGAKEGAWESGSSHRQEWASPTAEAETLKTSEHQWGTSGCLARSGSGPWTWGQRRLPPRSWDLKSRDQAAPRDPMEKEAGRLIPWSHFPSASISFQHPHLLNTSSSWGQGDIKMGTTQVSSAGSREEWGAWSLCKACRSPCLAVAAWVQGQPGVSHGFKTLSPPCCEVRSTLLSTQRSACWERGATVTEKEPRTPSLGNWRGGPPPSCPAPFPVPEDGFRSTREQH